MCTHQDLTDSVLIVSDAMALAICRSVRAERARNGLTQSALAERLGVSQSTIAAMESGTRRVYAHELPDICRALDTTLAGLLHGAPESDLRALGI